MQRKYRLRSNTDFQRARRSGKSWANHLIVLCAIPNHLDHNRFGFSVSKRVGNAVTRNRVRRRMREIVRLQHHSIDWGWDLVFVARPVVANASYVQMEKSIYNLLKRAGLQTGLSHEKQVMGVTDS